MFGTSTTTMLVFLFVLQPDGLLESKNLLAKTFFLKLDKTGLFKVEVVAEPGIHKAIKGALCPMYGRDLGKR
jgi:hypothetical protein